jgi:hypothetical protein
VQNWENLSFFTKFTNHEFVDVLIEQQGVAAQDPSSYLAAIFQHFDLGLDAE